MVAKLIRLRPGNFALTEESAAIEADPSGAQAQGADVVRLPHYARHAKTGEAEPPPGIVPPDPLGRAPPLVRGADGPGPGRLVLHGVGGIGKSVLAAQITERVGRLEPECVTTVLTGEVTAEAFLAGVVAALRRHPKARTAPRPKPWRRPTAPTCPGPSVSPCSASTSSARCRCCSCWTTSTTTCRWKPARALSVTRPLSNC